MKTDKLIKMWLKQEEIPDYVDDSKRMFAPNPGEKPKFKYIIFMWIAIAFIIILIVKNIFNL